MECCSRGEDWIILAKNLGVKYQTAYSWVRSGSTEGKKRGGARQDPLFRTSDNHLEVARAGLLFESRTEGYSTGFVQSRTKAKLLRDCNIVISSPQVLSQTTLKDKCSLSSKFIGNLLQ